MVTLSFADEQRLNTEFKSANGRFSCTLIDPSTWVITDEMTNDSLYWIHDEEFTSMTILISNDGCNLIVIDDFPGNWMLTDRTLLFIFRNGKLLKKYKGNDLISDTCSVFT